MNVAKLIFALALIFYIVLAEFDLGPYKVVVWNLTTCPGPTGTGDLDMYLVKETPENVHFIIEGNIKNKIGPIGGDLKWSVLGKKGYTTVFSFQSKKICESLKTKDIRATSLIPKVDNRCFLLKGPYRQEISDVNAAMHAFLGTSVPYGKYLVKLNVTAGRKLLICKYYRFETVPF